MKKSEHKDSEFTLVTFPGTQECYNIDKIKSQYPKAKLSFAGSKGICTVEDLRNEFPQIAEYLIR